MTEESSDTEFIDEITTDAVYCDHCGEDIEGDSFVLVRERDDAVLAICPSHISLKNFGYGYTGAEYANREDGT